MSSELPPNISPNGLALIGLYIAYFVAYSRENKIPCTTKTLLDYLPKLLSETYGPLADLCLHKSQVYSYKDVGTILDYLVSKKEFTYSQDDNPEDFNRPNCLVTDLKNAYNKHLENKLKKPYGTNTSNPYK